MQTINLAGRFGRNGLATTFFRNFATKPGNKLYELRLYQMKPECFREGLELLGKYWPVRTAHSKDVGSWMSEIGGICETVHMWEYDSLSDRIAKRQNVANDSVWRNEFLPKFFERSLKLTCLLMKPRPGTQVITTFPPSETAVYELWNSYQDSKPLTMVDNEIIVGQFETIYGQAEGEFTLFRYTDPELACKRAYQRRKASRDLGGHSRLLFPCHWSPLK